MSEASYQDKHLDLMIEMAFEQMDAEETRLLLEEPDPVLTEEEEAEAGRMYQAALDRADRQTKQEKKRERKTRALYALRYAAAVIVAVVVLGLIALPVTFVASAEFRNAVMRMFVQFDETQGAIHVSMQPEDQPAPEDALDVPTGPDWYLGYSYPQYLPQGFEVTAYDEVLNKVEWRDDAGRTIEYREMTGMFSEADLPEGAEYMPSEYPGNEIAVWEEQTAEGPRLTALRNAGDRRYQIVTQGLDREETLRIARFTELVAVKSRREAIQAFKDKFGGQPEPLAEITVPDWWLGQYFPTAWPEGLYLSWYSDNTVRYRNENGFVEYTEMNGIAEIMWDDQDMAYTPVEINGRSGALFVDEDEEGSWVILTWEAGEALLQLNAVDVPKEQVLALAESTERVQRPEGIDPMAARLPRTDENGGLLPPDGYESVFFPAWAPEDFYLESVYMDSNDYFSMKDRNGVGRYFSVSEYVYELITLPSLNTAREAKIVSVNGTPALLLRAGNSLGTALRLYWNPSESVTILLTAENMTEEEVLRVAESMRTAP